MRLIFVLLWSLFTSLFAQAEEVSMSHHALSKVVGPAHGYQVTGPAIQSTVTTGRSAGGAYWYTGVFTHYDVEHSSLVEVSPYVGVVSPLGKKWRLDVAVFAISDTEQVGSFAGVIKLERPIEVDEFTIMPQVLWQPQQSFDLPDGSYYQLAVDTVWQPKSFQGIQLGMRPVISYDTGAYGLPHGYAKHIELYVRHQLTDTLRLDYTLDGRRSATGESEAVWGVKVSTQH